MKKMFKAVATLAVGCALLSTSAFAALEGSVVESETAGVFTASVTKSDATAWESTILVLKAGSVDATGETPVIKSSVADGDIYYINQTSAKSATATYSIAQASEDLYVFAGGSNENAAKFLGTIAAPAAGPVVNSLAVSAVDGKTTLLYSDEYSVQATTQLVATVDPADTAVVWSSSNDAIATVDATGLVTASGEGKAVITATAGDKTATIEIDVYAVQYGDVNEDGLVDGDDALQIMYYDAWMDTIIPDDVEDDARMMAICDVNADGLIDGDDALQIMYYDAWMDSIFDKFFE